MPYNSGDVLNKTYRIEEWLGQGAFSDAYRVTHLTKQVARTLKILRTGIPDLPPSGFSWFADRFKMELKLDQVVNSSSHLVQVYETPAIGGMPALERDYAPLGNLTDQVMQLRANGKTISILSALQIALEVAEGLSVMHTRNIVYRNLKPGNILFDPLGSIKLSDLYLAQIPPGLGLVPSGPNDLAWRGRFAYMSPEQEQNKPKLKPASDIYSLGLILFELLTGNNYATLTPGTRVLSVREDIPEWLDDMVARMLQKNPERRPVDGMILAALLRADIDRAASEGMGTYTELGEYKEKKMVNPPAKDEIQPEQRTNESTLTIDVPIPEVAPKKEQRSIWVLLLNLLKYFARHPAMQVLALVLVIILGWILYQVLILK